MAKEPSVNTPMHVASTSPQCRRNMSTTIPPGKDMMPEDTSRTVNIAPTPIHHLTANGQAAGQDDLQMGGGVIHP